MADINAGKMPEHLAKYAFKPGQVANPKGRPKGARNRLGEAFIQALADDFDAHGKAAIETVRIERPHEYLKVVASILPKELNIRTDPLEELSDAELDRRIKQLAAALSFEIRTGEGDGSDGTAPEPEQAGGIWPLH